MSSSKKKPLNSHNKNSSKRTPLRLRTIPPLFPEQSTSDGGLSLAIEKLYFNPNPPQPRPTASSPRHRNAGPNVSVDLPYKVKVPQTVSMAKSYIMYHLNNTKRSLLTKPEESCSVYDLERCLSFYVSCLIYTDVANLCLEVKAMVLNNGLDPHFHVMTAKDVPPPLNKEMKIPEEFIYECVFIWLITCGKIILQSDTMDQHLTSWSTKRIKTLYTHMQYNDDESDTTEPSIINRNFDIVAISNFWNASPKLKKVVGMWLQRKPINLRKQTKSSVDGAYGSNKVTKGHHGDDDEKRKKMKSALFLQSQKILAWTGLDTFKYAHEFAVSTVKTKAHLLNEVAIEGRYVMKVMSTMERDLGREGIPYARLLGYPLLGQCNIHKFRNLAWCAIEFNKYVDLESWKNYKLNLKPTLPIARIKACVEKPIII